MLDRTKTHYEAEIEKGIPMPPGLGKAGKSPRWPFRGMEVGDSFLFPPTIDSKRAGTWASNAGARMNRKFSVRQTADGTRCWRIA